MFTISKHDRETWHTWCWSCVHIHSNYAVSTKRKIATKKWFKTFIAVLLPTTLVSKQQSNHFGSWYVETGTSSSPLWNEKQNEQVSNTSVIKAITSGPPLKQYSQIQVCSIPAHLIHYSWHCVYNKWNLTLKNPPIMYGVAYRDTILLQCWGKLSLTGERRWYEVIPQAGEKYVSSWHSE